MKFVVAVVMLVLAATVQASLIAQIAPGVSHVTSALPSAGLWGGISPWGGLGVHGPAAVAVHGPSAPWGHSGLGGWGVPGISLSQGIGPVAAPLGLGHGLGLGLGHGLGLGLGHGLGHEGVYVAKTRGAVHTAPLAGHISSAASINVAPAPGTH